MDEDLEARPCVIWVARDVTERHAQAEALLQTQKLESLGILAGGIAHDFNNLLAAIRGHLSLARLEVEEGSNPEAHFERMDSSIQRASGLARQLLAYSGQGTFQVEPVNLNALVGEMTELLGVSRSKKVNLVFQLGEGLPLVQGDRVQLQQVVMNLVINASEAFGEETGTVELATGTCQLDAGELERRMPGEILRPGEYVTLRVSDDGCGMEPEVLARIFDPFFTTKFTGRGLGLAAVLGIVRGHQGGLKVYSEPGKGTTFKLFFPVAAGQAQDSATPFADPAPFKAEGTVLVVDDEETVRTVAARMLERLGFSVITANDGREGMDKFRGEPGRFTLVLLDLTMPHLDGEETFRQMRLLNPNVRVILTSGFNQQEAINRFTGKGLAGFIQKPFELASLIQVIRSVLPHN
jgi:nitrogen-specific signal transduction histidine kinase